MAPDEIFMVKYIFMKTKNIEKNYFLLSIFDFGLLVFYTAFSALCTRAVS